MIKVNQLSKTFADQMVLQQVSVTIEPGDIIALIGSSGAGKSTFLRSLNALETADQGTITFSDLAVDFASITKAEKLALRRKTAMVFQQFALFERKTALENVMEGLVVVKKMPKAQAAKLASNHLEQVGLATRKNYYPRQLSGGQQQRVAIARALAMQPELLLLDEPTSALDPELVNEVLQTIQQAAKAGQTMVLVSHELDFVREVATKVLFLEHGEILESGIAQEIFERPKNARTKQFLGKFARTPEFII
ncbi:amino acid ABC transporter ATP-binding protein [Enterococcus sp. CSURQ0835]|uniref:amino acid ABC transporter ATP-binding protein n=1 Tax=Enterococcus sp. CSURQ0835 TaxID=2681394 RepID=UPI001357FFC5|nr:amino acid ABC transporter ATP-binding protein [Enterococcus sp. CSURQ0835]